MSAVEQSPPAPPGYVCSCDAMPFKHVHGVVDRAPSAESRSSVKLSMNSKGECQVEVKVYVDDTDEQVAAAQEIAQRRYDELAARYRA